MELIMTTAILNTFNERYFRTRFEKKRPYMLYAHCFELEIYNYYEKSLIAILTFQSLLTELVLHVYGGNNKT